MAGKMAMALKVVQDITFRKATKNDVGKLKPFFTALPAKYREDMPKGTKLTCETNIPGANIPWSQWCWHHNRSTLYVAEENDNVISSAMFSWTNGGETALLHFCLSLPNKKGAFGILYDVAWRDYLSENLQIKRLWGTTAFDKEWGPRVESANAGKTAFHNVEKMHFIKKGRQVIPVCFKTPKAILREGMPDMDAMQPRSSGDLKLVPLTSEGDLKNILQEDKITATLFPDGLFMASYECFSLMPENVPLVYPQCLSILKTSREGGRIPVLSFGTPYESSEETILDVDVYGEEGSEEICRHLERQMREALNYGNQQTLTCKLFAPAKVDAQQLRKDIQRYLKIHLSDKPVQVLSLVEGFITRSGENKL